MKHSLQPVWLVGQGSTTWLEFGALVERHRHAVLSRIRYAVKQLFNLVAQESHQTVALPDALTLASLTNLEYWQAGSCVLSTHMEL